MMMKVFGLIIHESCHSHQLYAILLPYLCDRVPLCLISLFTFLCIIIQFYTFVFWRLSANAWRVLYRCWLSVETGLIWAFVVPALIIICVCRPNLFSLVTHGHTLFSRNNYRCVGGVARWIGRRYLACGLSLTCARWLIGDHFVGKQSAMGQPTRPTQPSVPSGSVNK